jgi:telomerase reverse transcriptase
MSRTDFEKRKELLAEFVYFLFDSFLIPLVRSNFHVTESNNDKNRLFFFRLDVWHKITARSFDKLKKNMYEELPTHSTQQLLSIRRMGYSNLRLLPKRNNAFRPIINLRRRPEYISYGKRLLGRSINSVLTPVYKAIHYEAVSAPLFPLFIPVLTSFVVSRPISPRQRPSVSFKYSLDTEELLTTA